MPEKGVVGDGANRFFFGGGVALAKESSAGDGLFGHGFGPELALTGSFWNESIAFSVLSVVAGAAGASDPVPEPAVGCLAARWWRHASVFHPPMSEPREQLRGACEGDGCCCCQGLSLCVLKELRGLQPLETKVGHFTS